MGACAEYGIQMSFYTPTGKYLASVNSSVNGNVLLRKEQYRISDDPDKCLQYVKNIILGKVFNEKWVLERTIRNHSARLDTDKLKEASNELSTAIKSLSEYTDVDSLRGLEGKCADIYFNVFDEMILRQKDDFEFEGRSRRPPLDRINALLSFAYTLLANDCASALFGVGLDPYVGYLHKDRPGRKSLALDLMEELRSPLADRVVISMINENAISKNDFEIAQNNAVLLTDDGRKKFLNSWQTKKNEKISHPFLKEQVEWGLVPYVQAMLLARTIRGTLDEYPPFLWK